MRYSHPREILILLGCGVNSPRPDADMGVRAGKFDNEKSDTSPTQKIRMSEFPTTLSRLSGLKKAEMA